MLRCDVCKMAKPDDDVMSHRNQMVCTKCLVTDALWSVLEFVLYIVLIAVWVWLLSSISDC
jgi:hypothetical protein